MFDDERVLGPFSEAVAALPDDQRLTLYAMSVLAPGLSVSYDYTMRHLADNVATGDGIIARALAHGAAAVPAKTRLVQEEVAAHLHGLQGWAKISTTLPPAAADADATDPSTIVWRLVDELVLSLLRGDVDPARADQILAAVDHRTADPEDRCPRRDRQRPTGRQLCGQYQRPPKVHPPPSPAHRLSPTHAPTAGVGADAPGRIRPSAPARTVERG